MNPEDNVISDIDALIDESIRRGPLDSYTKPYSVSCSLCHGAWHGGKRDDKFDQELPRQDYFDGDCPGAYATDEQITEWNDNHPKKVDTETPENKKWEIETNDRGFLVINGIVITTGSEEIIESGTFTATVTPRGGLVSFPLLQFDEAHELTRVTEELGLYED